MTPVQTAAALRFPRTHCLIAWLIVASLAACSAATLDEAQKLFSTGEYEDCIAACETAIEQNPWQMSWRLLKIRAELATGRYTDALASYEAGMSRYNTSIPLRLLGYE